MHFRLATLVVALQALLACAHTASVPAPGRSNLFGTVTLLPPEGAGRVGVADASYADARYVDVVQVDYSRPGFAVVYVEGDFARAGAAAFSIRSSRFRTWIEPRHAALGAGAEIRVANATTELHVVSCPEAGVLQPLAPGRSLAMRTTRAGRYSIFLPDGSGASALAFAAPGTYTVVSPRGGWELRDLSPGPLTVRTFHPRFPSSEQQVSVEPGQALRVDLEIGVGAIHGEDR